MTKRFYSGLSLIELLVVGFALIVLVSLFLPSRAGARPAAKRVACASNMAQIGKAMVMYAQNPDNKKHFPTRSGDSTDAEQGDSQEALNLLYSDYLTDARVFRCAGDSTVKNLTLKRLRPTDSFLMSGLN